MQTAREFLLDAPPGEVAEVYNDVRVLVSDQVLQDGIIDVFEEHNQQQLIVAQYASGHVLLAKEAKSDKGYFDPHSEQIYAVDHMKLTATPVEHQKVDEYHKSLNESVREYVSNYYPSGYSSVLKSNEYTICIVAQKYNPDNFWSGRWRSIWTLQDGILKGKIFVHVHYYEDGNVQLKTEKEYSVQTDSQIPQIVKHIQKIEQEYQAQINTAFIESAVSTFKALRRQLPITRTKVDWQAIAAYKVGQELGK
ncbi:F-actin-capping protein subunit alpha [Gorgonomyces haynaldii]|nr:F-actin-capping protein subunit alpha [Gorgonomyces haynaldii]